MAKLLENERIKKRSDDDVCHVMCCNALTFVELCKLYPRSAELVKKDAEMRNYQLL